MRVHDIHLLKIHIDIRNEAEALFHLSRQVSCGPKSFSQAGTKDKRGVTLQFLTTFIGNRLTDSIRPVYLFNEIAKSRTICEVTLVRKSICKL